MIYVWNQGMCNLPSSNTIMNGRQISKSKLWLTHRMPPLIFRKVEEHDQSIVRRRPSLPLSSSRISPSSFGVQPLRLLYHPSFSLMIFDWRRCCQGKKLYDRAFNRLAGFNKQMGLIVNLPTRKAIIGPEVFPSPSGWKRGQRKLVCTKSKVKNPSSDAW